MEKYNIGQRIEFIKDYEVQGFLEKHIIKKGTKAWVTASNSHPSFYLQNGKELLLNKDNVELVGYDAEGLAEFIYRFLSRWLPLSDMMEAYDVEEKEFKDYIVEALEELGFYKGNTESKEATE